MEQPLPLFRNLPGSTWERLYWYFVEAEENQDILTSVKIQQVFLTDEGEVRELDNVRWHMYRYWRWFLFCTNDRVKPYHYRCKNIKAYPVEYFVQAHTIPDRMQYLVHFMRSINTDKSLRKLAVGRGQPRRPRQQGDQLPLPLVGDDVGLEDQQDDLDIQIDTHEEEEDSIQDTPTDEVSLDEIEVQETVSEGPQDISPDHDGDQQAPAGEEEIIITVSGSKTSPPPRQKRKLLSSWVIAGIVVAVCVVGTIIYIVLKQPR